MTRNSSGHDDRDHRQDRLGRQHRVDAGVRGAGDEVAVAGQQRVAVEPVGAGRTSRSAASQQAEVRPRGRGGASSPALQPDPAVEVVRGDRRDAAASTSTAVRKPWPSRSSGRVKTKKPMSRPNCGSRSPNGSRLSNSRTVCHRCASAEPANSASPTGSDEQHQPAQRLEALAVAVQARLLGVDRRVDRPGAVAHQQAAGHGARHQRRAHHEQHTCQSRIVVNTSRKPSWSNQSTSVHTFADQGQQQRQHTQDHQRGDQGRSAAAGTAGRSAGGRRTVKLTAWAPRVSRRWAWCGSGLLGDRRPRGSGWTGPASLARRARIGR